MRHIYAIIEKVADTPSTVLITGESGTGKELIARALHENSVAARRAVHQDQLRRHPQDADGVRAVRLREGRVHRRGRAKPGRFELAHGGTLFLDEIGEIPVEMQVKLLRVLQETEFERVGGIKTIKVDVRLVAATNRDLRREMATGGFREDLYYRLNVVPIHLPPLRERREDIPLLVAHFITKFNERLPRRSPASSRRRWSGWSRTTGRATSASSRTSSSGPCCSARAAVIRAGQPAGRAAGGVPPRHDRGARPAVGPVHLAAPSQSNLPAVTTAGAAGSARRWAR